MQLLRLIKIKIRKHKIAQLAKEIKYVNVGRLEVEFKLDGIPTKIVFEGEFYEMPNNKFNYYSSSEQYQHWREGVDGFMKINGVLYNKNQITSIKSKEFSNKVRTWRTWVYAGILGSKSGREYI